MESNILVGKELCKEYKRGKRNNVHVINNVNIEIKKGEFISILGRSGSGKTTLIQLLSGLLLPTKGEVLFDGKQLSSMREKERARFRNKNIGFVFQSFYIEKNFNAYDNVLFPLLITDLSNAERKERVEQAIEMVDLKNRITHRPTEMSGGEIQRLCIARAIVNEPDIIFADEPTGQLDSQTSKCIMELFKKLNECGKTLVMVTHNEKDAMEYSDNVVRICDGKIIGKMWTKEYDI